jgi:hypothetical protein
VAGLELLPSAIGMDTFVSVLVPGSCSRISTPQAQKTSVGVIWLGLECVPDGKWTAVPTSNMSPSKLEGYNPIATKSSASFHASDYWMVCPPVFTPVGHASTPIRCDELGGPATFGGAALAYSSQQFPSGPSWQAYALPTSGPVPLTGDGREPALRSLQARSTSHASQGLSSVGSTPGMCTFGGNACDTDIPGPFG